MIRVNLLAAEQQRPVTSGFSGLSANKVHILGASLVALCVAGAGYRHLDLQGQQTNADRQLAVARAEEKRLKAVTEELARFEAQTALLQQRVALIDLFQRLGAEGRTVIVSSHVLHEVERLARRQIVLVRGRLAAAGDHRAIRNAMADRPRRILVRTDGTPTYNFCVVVDDHDMGITHVIRGDDHLINAARQKQIYDAIGWALPSMSHIPLIHGPDGSKLSKRHGALGVDAYRAMGYLPAALRNYLVRLGWSHGDQEIFSTEEMIEAFDLASVGRAAARADPWRTQGGDRRRRRQETGAARNSKSEFAAKRFVYSAKEPTAGI